MSARAVHHLGYAPHSDRPWDLRRKRDGRRHDQLTGAARRLGAAWRLAAPEGPAMQKSVFDTSTPLAPHS